MQLYLNLPLKSGMVLVLVDSTNKYKQLQPTRFRFFPNEGVEVADKIGERFLKEKNRKSDDGVKTPFLSKEPYAGEWPVELDVVPRMPKRRTRAGQLRPQGNPDLGDTHVARRLPTNMPRQNSKVEVKTETTKPALPLNEIDGDERFTRIERDDVSAGRKLKSLADRDFAEMGAAVVGQAVKLLGFKFTEDLELKERQTALEKMCEIVSKEVEIPK